MKASDFIGGNWVKCPDLQGQEVTVTIENVTAESYEEGDPERLVLQFVGMKKRLGLNSTNTASVAGLWGDETDDWIGKNVTLYPSTCMFQGNRKDCIRIRDARPTEEPLPVPDRVQPSANGKVAF